MKGGFLAAVLLLPLFLAAAFADAQELLPLTLTPTQVGSQVQLRLEADSAPAMSVTVTVQATLQGMQTSEITSIDLGPDAGAYSGAFPAGALPPGDYDFSVTEADPPGIVSNTLQGTTTLTVELGVSYTLLDGPVLPAGSEVRVMITLNGEVDNVAVRALPLDSTIFGEGTPRDIESFRQTGPLSFTGDNLVQTVFFLNLFSSGAGIDRLVSGTWRFTALANEGATPLNNDDVTRLVLEEPIPATLIAKESTVTVGADIVINIQVEPPGLSASLGNLKIRMIARKEGIRINFPHAFALLVPPNTTASAVFRGLALGNWEFSGVLTAAEIPRTIISGSRVITTSEIIPALLYSNMARVSVVLSKVTFELVDVPVIDVENTMQRAVTVGSDVRFGLSVDRAPQQEVNITVNAVNGETTITASAALSSSTFTAEVLFSEENANALSEGTWEFRAVADVEDSVVFQPIASVTVLTPRVTLASESGSEGVPVTLPVRLTVATVPLAPRSEVAIEIMAAHENGTSSSAVTVHLSPNMASTQAVFTPEMLGVTGVWTFTATAMPAALADVDRTGITVTTVLPSLMLTAEQAFVIRGDLARLLVNTNAPVQEQVLVTVTGLSLGVTVTVDVSLTPANSTGTADFDTLAEGIWTFIASAVPEDVVETASAVSEVTVVVNTERLLSSVSLTPTQIVEGASATLRAVITDAANTMRTLSIQRDGTEEIALAIPAGSTSAEVIVRGDGLGTYTYSLADPDNSFDNEGEFSLPLRVVADIRLSLEPAQGSLPIVGNAVRITASLLNATGSALRLEAGVTLTLQAEADTGDLIPGITLQIAEMTTSGATTFIPPTTGTWTVTVRDYLPSDALLAPTAEIASATIAVSPRLRLLLMPNAPTVLSGNPISIGIVNTEPASEVEITGLTVSASQPGQTTADRSLDSFALPAEIVFRLSTGTWSFEVTAAEPEYGIDISAATAAVTVEVNTERLLSSASLTPTHIVEGASATLRAVITDAANTMRTLSIQRDGTEEIALAIPAGSTSAEAIVRGDGLGAYAYSLADPDNLFDNEEEFSLPLRVVADIRLSLEPAQGSLPIAGNAVRITASLLNATGSALRLEAGVTLTLQAEADTGGLIPDIALQIAELTTSGATTFIPPTTGAWTVTVRDYLPPDALLAPTAEIAAATIAVSPRLRLMLIPNLSTVLSGNPISIGIVNTEPASEVEITGLTVRASQPGQTAVDRSLDSFALPAEIVFRLRTGTWSFEVTVAEPVNGIDISAATATVTVEVNTERLLSSASLTPTHIVEGASAILRVVITDAVNTMRTLSIQRDGTEESALAIPAGSTSAEVIVRGDGLGAYTYSLADPDNSFDNEEEFSLPLRVVADIQLSLEPVQGSLPIAGNAVRITASLLNATGSALRLGAGVTLTLQAEADTGDLIPGIALQIAEMTASGATTFIPPTTGTWTVTVSDYLPPDALLAPAAEITSATIAVSPRLRLLLIPNASTVPFGNPITIGIVNTELASEVEITGLAVRASQPGQTAVDRSLDSFALPAEIVFRLRTGTWSFEVTVAEPVYGIDTSAATATVTVEEIGEDIELELDLNALPNGIDADDLILLLRYLELCPEEVAADCQAMGSLADNLSEDADAYDLSRLRTGLVPDITGDEKQDIFLLLNYLSGIEDEILFPASVPEEDRDALLQIIRQMLGIE